MVDAIYRYNSKLMLKEQSNIVKTPTKAAIVIPVFNDWLSMERLVGELDRELANCGLQIDIVAVDDCSTEQIGNLPTPQQAIASITVLKLGTNVGHQRAIATGLSKVASDGKHDLVAVMDSDGEDKPQELLRLLRIAVARPDQAVVAQRKKRLERATFRFSYRIYTLLFRVLTGNSIDFGNFVVLPIQFVHRLIRSPNIWNNFSASLVRARLPLTRLETVRGKRYFGKSKMNFVALVAHGLGAISVFSDVVFIRILLASLLILMLSLMSVVVTVAVRLFTDLAVPGWATNVTGFALIISMQAVLLPVMMAFLILNNRSSVQILPKYFAIDLVEETRAIERPGLHNEASP